MESFQESILDNLSNPIVFTIPLFGGIPVAQSVVGSWITMATIMILTLLLTQNLKERNPGKVQIVIEAGVSYLNNFVKEHTGERWRSFAPYLGTITLYIALSNVSGLFGISPPTKDVNVTAALAVMSGVLIYGAQFYCRGFIGGLKHFAEPIPLLLPINLMEIFVRPLALCMRLFGNILGAYIIMEMIKYFLPIVVPVPFSLYFDLFDGAIQTIIFVFLTTLFLGEGIQEEE
ncbi:MAG: F0F1 ATP synthase subunit A [Oscillospiraceae bacterium]